MNKNIIKITGEFEDPRPGYHEESLTLFLTKEELYRIQDYIEYNHYETIEDGIIEAIDKLSETKNHKLIFR